MRKIFLALIIGLFLGGFTPGAHAQARSLDFLPSYWPGGEMHPKTVIAEASHDFGEVKPGITVTYDFKVQNQGDGPLIIDHVTPG